MIAGHQFKTVNHMSGSPREKLHHDCKAIDFRPEPNRLDEIKTYLRSRPEISGIETYRDGVVHMDIGTTNVASRRPSNSAAGAVVRRHAEVAQEPSQLAQAVVVSTG